MFFKNKKDLWPGWFTWLNSIRSVNLIIWLKRYWQCEKKKLAIINYKKISCQYNTRKEKKENYASWPLERANQNGFKAIAKGYTITSKKITHTVKTTTQKANQIIYHEVSISCLYLIN
jgi:hypothetical protein